MQSELLIAIFTGLGAMMCWGSADFFAKRTIDKIGDYSTLFWSQLIGALPLLLITFYTRNIPVLKDFDPVIILGFGLLDAISWFYLYRGFEKGEVSLLSPIFASYSAVAVLISAFIFGESIPVLRWFSLVVIFGGILLISLDIKNFKEKINFRGVKGLPEILTALLQYSIWIALWGHFINGKEWVFIYFLVRVIIAVSILITCRIKKISLKIKDNKLWKFLIIIGLFDVAAYSLVSIGFSKTSLVSIVAVLSGAFSLPTIVLARIFLKEKVTSLQTIGSFIIIAGIMILSIYR